MASDAIHSILSTLQRRVETARGASRLAAPSVTLLAASKGQGAEIITEAIQAGITDFGENRVQEAAGKWPALRAANPGVKLHLIGPLQSNKVKRALELFDVIQTIDRASLAEAIALEIEKARRLEGEQLGKEKYSRLPDFPISRLPTLYIQINTGEEPQKAGVYPAEADSFIHYCIGALQLPVIGLMCIPPENQPPAPHFALLRQIALRHHLLQLSMGMSDDFEMAVRMGSSCVRLGRALFGVDSR